jgi:hypothetical protein
MAEQVNVPIAVFFGILFTVCAATPADVNAKPSQMHADFVIFLNPFVSVASLLYAVDLCLNRPTCDMPLARHTKTRPGHRSTLEP